MVPSSGIAWDENRLEPALPIPRRACARLWKLTGLWVECCSVVLGFALRLLASGC